MGWDPHCLFAVEAKTVSLLLVVVAFLFVGLSLRDLIKGEWRYRTIRLTGLPARIFAFFGLLFSLLLLAASVWKCFN